MRQDDVPAGSSHLTGVHVEAFRVAVADHLGLKVEDDRLVELRELLAVRLRATQAASVESYLASALPAPTEMFEVAQALSVGETYFFRHRDQMDAFRAILRAGVAAGMRRLRVLSAGCASGEEPYSLAMLAREELGSTPACDVSIVALDVSAVALAKAEEGRYGAWSLRETPEAMQRRYLDAKGQVFVLDPTIKAMVRFERRSLIMPDPAFWQRDAFDVIFCRNVLMYFTAEAASETASRLVAALAPGGWLFLGHAETMRGLTRGPTRPPFELELHPVSGAFVYRRRGATVTVPFASPLPLAPPEHIAPALDETWFASIGRASERIETLASRAAPEEPTVATTATHAPTNDDRSMAPALELLQRERYQDALAFLSAERHGDPSPEALLLRSVLLLQSGEFSAAEATCRALLARDLEAGAHYLLGLCREQAGDAEGATLQHRAAAFLDPAFAMPRLHLGLLARRRRDADEARREIALAKTLFAREDPARILLFGGGFARDALIAMCEAELSGLGDRP